VSLDVDDIVARCRQALAEHTPPLAVRDVLAQLVRAPAALEAALGPIEEGGIETLHRAPDLTLLRIAWTPGISINPHEHAMWAVVGIYGGQEDNVFYRRSTGGLQSAGGRELRTGDVLVMGDDAIHAVANPRREFAVALHAYGGDFFEGNRSEWDPMTFAERPRDLDGTRRLFAEANAAWRAG
jgi:predicted metal-dependent enzyme (double-stranded beta helix superfamily)